MFVLEVVNVYCMVPLIWRSVLNAPLFAIFHFIIAVNGTIMFDNNITSVDENHLCGASLLCESHKISLKARRHGVDTQNYVNSTSVA